MTNKTHIPDEAVQAALDVCDKVDWVPALAGTGLCGREVVVSALTAAYPHLFATCAVEAMHLDWVADHNLAENHTAAYAKTEIGCYEAFSFESGGRLYHGWSSGKGDKKADSFEAAKAAAQADFEGRILSCVVTKPVDVAAGLEQAAKFLDQRAHDYVQEHGMTDPSTGVVELPGWGDEYVSELEELAEAIRAKKGQHHDK